MILKVWKSLEEVRRRFVFYSRGGKGMKFFVMDELSTVLIDFFTREGENGNHMTDCTIFL